MSHQRKRVRTTEPVEKKQVEKSQLETLILDLFIHILSFLNFPDVIRMREVSRYFNHFIGDNRNSVANFYYYHNDNHHTSAAKFLQLCIFNVKNINIIDRNGTLTWQHMIYIRDLRPKKVSFYTKNLFLYRTMSFDWSMLEYLSIQVGCIELFEQLKECKKLKFFRIKNTSGFEHGMYDILKYISSTSIEFLKIGNSTDIDELFKSINPSVRQLTLSIHRTTRLSIDYLSQIPSTIEELIINDINSPLPPNLNVRELVLKNVDGHRFEETFTNLKDWKNLEKVSCINCDLPTNFFKAIGENKSVRYLSLKDYDFFNPRDFIYLRYSRIEYLKIYRCENVSDTFGNYIEALPELKHLELASEVSGKFFFRIMHKSITSITIDGSMYFCNNAINAYPPSIEEIYLRDIHLIDNNIIPYLKQLKNLKKITFEECPSISNIQLYRKELPGVKSINII